MSEKQARLYPEVEHLTLPGFHIPVNRKGISFVCLPLKNGTRSTWLLDKNKSLGSRFVIFVLRLQVIIKKLTAKTVDV